MTHGEYSAASCTATSPTLAVHAVVICPQRRWLSTYATRDLVSEYLVDASPATSYTRQNSAAEEGAPSASILRIWLSATKHWASLIITYCWKLSARHVSQQICAPPALRTEEWTEYNFTLYSTGSWEIKIILNYLQSQPLCMWKLISLTLTTSPQRAINSG